MLHMTSDDHIEHPFMLKVGRERHFSTLEVHDREIMYAWNHCVRPQDQVWFVGDFSFAKKALRILYWNSLNGQKHFIPGNHDDGFAKQLVKEGKNTTVHERLVTVHYERQTMEVCHFPIESWEGLHKGRWHLHGHCHNNLTTMPNNKRLDIGVDSAMEKLGAYRPFSFDDITKIMETKTCLTASDHHKEKT